MSILTQSFTGNFITHLRNIYMGKNIKSIEQKKKKKSVLSSSHHCYCSGLPSVLNAFCATEPLAHASGPHNCKSKQTNKQIA